MKPSSLWLELFFNIGLLNNPPNKLTKLFNQISIWSIRLTIFTLQYKLVMWIMFFQALQIILCLIFRQLEHIKTKIKILSFLLKTWNGVAKLSQLRNSLLTVFYVFEHNVTCCWEDVIKFMGDFRGEEFGCWFK